MDKEILYVVLPCYNEEENISDLIKEWKTQESKLYERNILLKLIIVNDGSSDKTLEIARGLENVNNNIKVLNHEVNKGLGEGLNTGINYVISQKRKGLLCIMDADMTHSPEYIYSMLNKLSEKNLDCVVASRYRKGSKVEGLSLYRKFLSYGARALYTLKLRIPNVRDYTCGYRLYKISALEVLVSKYNGEIVKERGFACMMELLARFSREGFRIGEVPFILKYQLKGGQSKMRVWRTIYRSMIILTRL
jgi:Glycosyltransferases involved in cell wall biogenesis